MLTTADVGAEREHSPPATTDGLLAAFTLPAVPQSASGARARVRAALASSGLTALTSDAELIVNELAVNALRHAASPVDVVLIAAGGGLMIIVADSSRLPPVMGGAGDGESGRGLVIVDGIADRWGWWPSSSGKSVWAALLRPAYLAAR